MNTEIKIDPFDNGSSFLKCGLYNKKDNSAKIIIIDASKEKSKNSLLDALDEIEGGYFLSNQFDDVDFKGVTNIKEKIKIIIKSLI